MNKDGHQHDQGDDMVYLSPGLALRARRQAMGLTQTAFSEMVGVGQSSYAKWEVRALPPPQNRIDRLARVLHATPDDLRAGRLPRRLVHPEWLSSVQTEGSRTRTNAPASSYDVLNITATGTAETVSSIERLRDDIAYLETTSPALLIPVAAIVSVLRAQVEGGCEDG